MENRDSRHYPVNAIRVCIDAYDEDVKGRIYSKMSGKAFRFENCSELFLRADQLFDRCGYPQSFQEKRDFHESGKAGHYARPKICLGDAQIRSQSGKLSTLDILVKSRRRAGWQGSILKEEGGVLAEFQSEMELLRYLGINRECENK